MTPINRNSDTLLTPAEVAERLRMKLGWVYRHANKLGGIRLGKYWRFDWLTVSQRLQHPSLRLPTERYPRDKTSN
jgi:hypothetical protein